ncbi:PREDICTED: inositol hexakisphosphate and diphosphoinositol-pentakisphosphate kinase 2 isoform X20 [Cercocebus atys]|uniref:inositol hexakisphosphate and diphosphoinositol-pentakisphosphate kinase 2 isoform X20 n=1 Tax=Cercocebus atys TaxID=9531 RepID=UPI0005F3F780|nr:PREDICTED: inositol hexakisphosphate and diphosphoinositol-pentakisphosphate kinase 2 isoform X20 [Cercocebus atys]
MSEAPRFFVGPEDTEINPGNYRHFFHHADEDDEEEDDSPPERQIVVGICSMAKKSKSKPMKEILERISLFKYITVVVFEEEVILNEPVENWPLCDCLISFHSKGFPLDKAVAYAKLRNPFVINDLNMQYLIQDRREVYSILQAEGILLPRYAILNRDPNNPKECNLIEGEDHVEVNGEVFQKPFVEKPVSAEDHNVYIYYPTSAGGGSQRLFRKIGSRSSVYSPESNVRKTGSYIYEEFMPTDGTDVKVYTVGPDYAHAEARKSPALDGKVERDSEGKEVRYPVILNAREKLIAWKVCLAFKQTVCGFDLLRANGQSYVCDVNGFSFVKNSMKYYDDCAKILGNIVMRELAPQFHIPWSIPLEAEDIPIVPTTSGTMMELRCVIAVIRHGDRTPKQKMKMEVRHQKFFDLFEKCDGYKSGKLKLKKPKQLQEVLDIARQLLMELGQNNDSEIEENKPKLEQLKTVLEMYGHFSGINRKVQLTYLPHGCPKTSSEEEDSRREEPSLLLVLKWGGELTPAGRVQAEELGRAFRCMYPGGQGDYAGFPGCGLLRLHSTYRHDLKIYASDEGRVQMTAAAFAKGLLALEGELTPILVQMVKSANMNGLLDSDSDSLSSCQQRVKARLHEILQKDRDFTAEDYEKESKDEQWKRAMDYLNVVNELNYMTQIVIMLYEDPNKDLSSEERFHVELHFSPGAKGCEEDKNLPSGYGYRPASRENEGRRPFKTDNDDEPHTSKRDEVDRAVILFKPMVSEPIHIHRKSPLPRSRKMATNDVNYSSKILKTFSSVHHLHGYQKFVLPKDTQRKRLFSSFCEESPLSVSSPEGTGTWLHYTSGVGTGRRRRRSGEQITSSPVSPKSLAFTSSIFGSWQQVVSENANYLRTPRTLVEQKQNPTVGSHCAGLFSTSVLGGSSSAPNLQDYARTHRKKLTSSGCIDDATRGSAVKRFSISFARHPTNGFELYSMVPSICPLETLHNALSLKQVDEFLASIASPSSDVPRKTPEISSTALRSSPIMRKKVSLNTYTPAKILPTPPATLKSTKASSKPAASGPSSAVVPNTSSRKKSITSKTETHEHKKNTGKKK